MFIDGSLPKSNQPATDMGVGLLPYFCSSMGEADIKIQNKRMLLEGVIHGEQANKELQNIHYILFIHK